MARQFEPIFSTSPSNPRDKRSVAISVAHGRYAVPGSGRGAFHRLTIVVQLLERPAERNVLPVLLGAVSHVREHQQVFSIESLATEVPSLLENLPHASCNVVAVLPNAPGVFSLEDADAALRALHEDGLDIRNLVVVTEATLSWQALKGDFTSYVPKQGRLPTLSDVRGPNSSVLSAEARFVRISDPLPGDSSGSLVSFVLGIGQILAAAESCCRRRWD